MKADKNKNFFKRWSDRKSGLEKDEIKKQSKNNKNKIKNQILESNKEIDKKYADFSDDEVLDKLNLPDPNKIKKEEDLNVFFKKSIPERLKRLAMRRLWRLNPVISFADSEINDYAEDFTDAATVVEDLQTSYIVGQGHFNPEIKKNEESEEELSKENKKEAKTLKQDTKESKTLNQDVSKNKNKKILKKNEKNGNNIKIKTNEVEISNKSQEKLEKKDQEKKQNFGKTIKPKNLTFRKS